MTSQLYVFAAPLPEGLPSEAAGMSPEHRHPSELIDGDGAWKDNQRMHAIVATVAIEDVGSARVALSDLRLTVVPKAPGFVSAYWLEPINGIGMSVIIFETQAAAQDAMSYPLPALPGVTPMTLELREVFASA